jgi:hypothetical protein
VAIDGCYLTAELGPPGRIGKPVEIRLADDTIQINLSA